MNEPRDVYRAEDQVGSDHRANSVVNENTKAVSQRPTAKEREDLDVPQREVKIATYRINKIGWRSAPSGGMADEIPAALPLRISILML